MVAKSMLLACLVVGLAIFVAVFVDLQPYATPQYSELRTECYELDEAYQNCCLTSVDAMEELRAFEIQGNDCPPHFTFNMQKCLGSYQWCEPDGTAK